MNEFYLVLVYCVAIQFIDSLSDFLVAYNSSTSTSPDCITRGITVTVVVCVHIA